MNQIPKFDPARALKLNEVSHWDIETEVAVVGFGGAGSCAAIEAARAGASVQVFEAFSAAGGSTALSGGEVYLGGNGGTPIQKKFGFDDSTGDFFNYLMMQHAPRRTRRKSAPTPRARPRTSTGWCSRAYRSRNPSSTSASSSR
ncbi:FAD-dependent oxidoreductase [Marinobacterium aestuariivivens]|uniref:FAD-dependent oxidoreductase n=1 Tax=Marinobacterium aestuariivivens TaxID=1698799 RepID=A0ABW2A3L5_9GAMM